jgi:ubiquinone/menaquinone biosynthesis C-methylase UbiE
LKSTRRADTVKQLDDHQLQSFDVEYVDDQRWQPLRHWIDRDFQDGNFRFLDVGGGNGELADRILAAYPRSSGVVLDNSKLLLAANKPHPRKTTLLESAENLHRIEGKFDIVFFNWVLHHLVERKYGTTRANIHAALNACSSLLTSDGRVSVYENTYQGMVIDSAPGRIIYAVTSSRLLRAVARRGGANTAGIGVCFLSKRQWKTAFEQAGLHLLGDTEPDNYVWPLRLSWKICLHIRHIRICHFWLSHVNNLQPGRNMIIPRDS